VARTEHSGAGDPARSLALLWRHHLGEVTARGPRPSLTVDQVVAAAIDIADVEGLPALSMRRVAHELGVSTMSLYTYVPAKAELVDLMVDTVYSKMRRPAWGRRGWRKRIETIARHNRALYDRHPWLTDVSTSRPPLGPGVMTKYEHELRGVDGLGLTDVEMDSVLTLVLDFTHASARSAQAAAQAAQDTAMTDEQWWAANEPLLSRIFDASRFPAAARVGSAAGAEYGAAYSPAHAFEFGLRRLLDGIGVLVERRRNVSRRAGRGGSASR
jgi:AcrR family transcriptional regulator